MKDWFTYFLVIVLIIVLLKQCEGDERTVAKTKIEYVKVTNTVTKTKIDTIFKKVYVNKYVDKQGENVIVYVDKPNDSTIEANKYNTTLLSNNATAELEITTTGELLDVSGVITYPEKETTTTITKTRDASGLYLYGSAPIKSKALTPEIGLQFNIKNKMFISSGVQYNNITNNLDIKVGIGVKIW